jgi:hypothetical protein
MIINSHFEGLIYSNDLKFLNNFLHSAGHSSEARSNRRLNFQSTTTKLSIPHEFIQRAVQPTKRIAAIVIPNASQGLEATSSVDSVPRPIVGKFHSISDLFFFFNDLRYRCNEIMRLCSLGR